MPARFERALFEAPDAPAVIRLRAGGRKRVWSRAAVEHHAVRVACNCADQGLKTQARVALGACEPVERLGALWFILATGRVLSAPAGADLVMGPSAFRPLGDSQDYLIRNVVAASDPALHFGEPISHAALSEAIVAGRPLCPAPLWIALRALYTGEPLVFGPAEDASSTAA